MPCCLLRNLSKQKNFTYLKMMRGQFRYFVWDPFLIISQIIAVQAFFYLTLGVCVFLIDIIFGYSHSLDHIFLYKETHVRDFKGRCLAGSYLLNSLCGAVALRNIVQRTKLCLDFTMTAHLIHLIVCWSYSGSFPSTLSWWLLNTICVTMMCVCGEFLCMRTEMKSIPLSMGAKADL